MLILLCLGTIFWCRRYPALLHQLWQEWKIKGSFWCPRSSCLPLPSLYLVQMLINVPQLWQGTAEVVFSRRSDAVAAVKRYNNVQLDGKPMKIEIIGTNIEAPPMATFSFNPPSGNFNGPFRRLVASFLVIMPVLMKYHLQSIAFQIYGASFQPLPFCLISISANRQYAWAC